MSRVIRRLFRRPSPIVSRIKQYGHLTCMN
jgi:hypothetical protein